MTNPPRVFGTPRRQLLKLSGDSQAVQFSFASIVGFPLAPPGTTQTTHYPIVQIAHYRDCFGKTKITAPDTQVLGESINSLLPADTPMTVRQLPYPGLESIWAQSSDGACVYLWSA